MVHPRDSNSYVETIATHRSPVSKVPFYSASWDARRHLKSGRLSDSGCFSFLNILQCIEPLLETYLNWWPVQNPIAIDSRKLPYVALHQRSLPETHFGSRKPTVVETRWRFKLRDMAADSGKSQPKPYRIEPFARVWDQEVLYCGSGQLYQLTKKACQHLKSIANERAK